MLNSGWFSRTSLRSLGPGFSRKTSHIQEFRWLYQKSMVFGLCHGIWTFLAIFQLDDSGKIGELGQEFWWIRYRNFDEPGVRCTRTSYGILEKIVHGILRWRACMFYGSDWQACMYVLQKQRIASVRPAWNRAWNFRRRACMFYEFYWQHQYDRCW